MGEDTRHNGFANYETWLVSLWMNNDFDSYQRYRQIAREIFACSPTETVGCCTYGDAAINEIAEALKEELEAGSPVGQEASIYADLIHAALAEVDWYELAEELLCDTKEDHE